MMDRALSLFCRSKKSTSTRRLTSLYRSLQSPAVPQTLPSDMSILTSLSLLNITGDHTIPSGQLNSSLPSSLRTLQLFNTSLQGFSDDALFQQNGTLANLTSLIMDGNLAMGSTLPPSLTGIQLQTLYVSLISEGLCANYGLVVGLCAIKIST